MQHAWVDCSQAPIYIIKFPEKAPDEVILELIGECDAFYKTVEQPFGWISDLAGTRSTTAAQRRLFAEHHKRNRQIIERWCFGMAYVADSAVVRGIITAFMWIVPPFYPHRVVAVAASAHEWLEKQQENYKLQ